jgi:signal transduction histidine kinase
METQFERYNKDEMKEMLRMLSDSSKNTLTLIENLVQWAKLQADGWKMERKNIRLSSIIKQNIRIYSNMATQKKISFVNETDDFLMVNADENMLMLVVRNLINNAIKFTPEGGEIKIQAIPKRRYIRISIADTGTGMSPEQITKILMKDENVSETGTLGEKGSGLGLLLCKEFIEKHNCRMYIDSNKEQGTIVTFTMPAAKPESRMDEMLTQ